MSNQEFKFALNHMACPTLSPLGMLVMAAELGIHAVELCAMTYVKRVFQTLTKLMQSLS